MSKLPIGITMGCPVGIGPEIIVKYLAAVVPADFTPVVVLGDMSVLSACAAGLNIAIPIKEWQPGRQVDSGAINVLPLSKLGAELTWGQPDQNTGAAMARYITEAVRLVMNGDLAAMVTCPITKKTLNQAGFMFPGHTEMLAALCQSDEYVMMLAGERLRVTLVTIHTPLAEVPGRINVQSVFDLIRLTHLALQRDFGLVSPRLAVAGLNPHAGEQGMFGHEEEEKIAPAVEKSRAQGLNVIGPLPPDTVFNRAAGGEFDAVVCMYHDQGLIPFKLLHFADGVNVTLGLPIVRTSVDHGTAYDIAGRGVADCSSLAAAVTMAGQIYRNRQTLEAVNSK